jgi:hypothetical protein
MVNYIGGLKGGREMNRKRFAEADPREAEVALSSAIFPLLHDEINCFDLLSIAAFRSHQQILGYPQIQYV